jgi:Cof subfamily protein (haloacid dehalogenase superfamily)
MTEPIKLIIVDIDGTLLNDSHKVSEGNERALKAAAELGVHLVLATGKTRTSGQYVIDKLGLQTPGIYLQGLAIYQADGSISYQQTLDINVARQVITYAQDRGYDLIAYSGSHILVSAPNEVGHRLHERYHEPEAEPVGPLVNVLDELPIHKIIAVKTGNPRAIAALRWQLDKQLDGRAKLVQAGIADMLEIVPSGSSKGTAMRVLLKELGVKAENVLAIGDGENDIEMIQQAGIGVAVGNATDKLKAVADHVVASNNDDGVAEAIKQFVPGVRAKLEAPTPETVASNGTGDAKPNEG